MASGVSRFREEITAILNIADKQRGDRVIIQLNSPGGTVTGYGLAASQIARLKKAGLHVTVSVDEVAASGGYMMACVADRIVAAPFAIIGSIGVVQTMPNFSDALERHGIVVEDVTAGKYKRTMTPYKKTTEEDRNKVKSDLEAVYTLFKNFIQQNRPQITNIDAVATGEIWHATDAVKKGLIDDLLTTDDLLLQCRDAGYDVYKLSVRPLNGGFPPGPNEEAAMLYDGESASFADRVVFWLSSIVSRVVSDVIRKEFTKTMALETGSYAWTVPSSSFEQETATDHPLQHRFLAVDPQLTQFPPRA